MSARATVTEVLRDAHTGALVATVDAGFVDGIPDWIVRPDRVLNLPQSGFEVLVRGRRAPVLAIEAQTMTIDVSGIDGVSAGDEVTLFGSHLAGAPVLQEIADSIGTVGEEIVVRVGPRSPREYLVID
jgi:alanine racemase